MPSFVLKGVCYRNWATLYRRGIASTFLSVYELAYTCVRAHELDRTAAEFDYNIYSEHSFVGIAVNEILG